MRWSNSVLVAVVALFVGVSLGYLAPRSAAGNEDGKWMPLGFEKAMEVFTGTSHTYVPHEPGFVSEGHCKLSGQAKFYRLETDEPGLMRLGYGVDFAAPPTPTPNGDATQSINSPYNVQLSFSLFDADGFRLHTVRTGTQRLNPAESCSFQDIVRQPIPGDIADRTDKIECRLCFEGIEIP
jgi:hypothetical protein